MPEWIRSRKIWISIKTWRGAKEVVESENNSDSDSGRCSRNSMQRPREKPEESRNNDKCQVASED